MLLNRSRTNDGGAAPRYLHSPSPHTPLPPRACRSACFVSQDGLRKSCGDRGFSQLVMWLSARHPRLLVTGTPCPLQSEPPPVPCLEN